MQPKITEMFFSPSVSIKRQEQITDSLVKFIAKDMLPLSTVDGVGFVEFMNKISPNYEIPSRLLRMPLLQWLQTLKVGHVSLIHCSYVSTKAWKKMK